MGRDALGGECGGDLPVGGAPGRAGLDSLFGRSWADPVATLVIAADGCTYCPPAGGRAEKAQPLTRLGWSVGIGAPAMVRQPDRSRHARARAVPERTDTTRQTPTPPDTGN